jgi:hypothetical protein
MDTIWPGGLMRDTAGRRLSTYMTPMTTSDRRRRAQPCCPAFAGQLVTVRYLGTFLGDPLEVPAGILGYVAGQLGVANPSCVRRCGGQKQPVGGRM